MSISNISNARLVSQHITNNKFKTIKDLVSHMGAMQAQDYNMAKWAIGVRLPGITEKIIEESFNKGDILRTHVLRPTWHFVSVDDIYWMLELTGPKIKNSLKSRSNELGITPAFLNKSYAVLEKILSNYKHLTRAEIVAALKKSKINVNSSQIYHLMLNAELDAVACSGTMKGKNQTYSLLSERVTKKKKLKKDEALAELAKRYFSSHGHATLQDFAWWSSFSATETKRALEVLKSDIVCKKINSKDYWFLKSSSFLDSTTKKESVYLLPAYDEFLVSYKDRTASISSYEHQLAVSTNGVFRPIIVVNGQVIGRWQRIVKKNHIVVGINLFKSVDKKIKQLIQERAMEYGSFCDREVKILWN